MDQVQRVADDAIEVRHAPSIYEAVANLAPGFASVAWAYTDRLFMASDLDALRAAALEVQSVIPGSPVMFNEVDFSSGSVITVSRPPEATAPARTAAYARLRHEHPVINHYGAGGSPRPLAISDVTDEQSFTSTALYREVYTALGMRDQLLIPVPVGETKMTVTLCVGREAWGFSDQEHVAAALIQRALGLTYRSRCDRRSAGAANSVASSLLDRSGVQVCVVDGFGEIGGLGGHAERLEPNIAEAIAGIARLAQITPVQKPAHEQKSVIAEFKVKTGRGDLATVQLLPSTDGEVWPVVIRNTSSDNRLPALAARGLTQRQAEVMALLLSGRTTAGAALELGISPRTAEKHITLACRALGAHSRTEALIALASGADAAA